MNIKNPLVVYSSDVCGKCNNNVKVYYLGDNSEKICPECYIKENIPEIHFVERNDNGYLWSRENQCAERMDIEELEECGWFVKEIEIEHLHDTELKIKTYKLQYHGEKACPRCVNITFGKDTPKCHNYLCSSSTQTSLYDYWD